MKPISLKEIEKLPFANFREKILDKKPRIVAFFGQPLKKGLLLYAILTFDEGEFFSISSEVEKGFLSLTPDSLQADLFEREIFEQYRVKPEGHPNLKPLRCLRDESDFFKIDREEVHEVAVGPVHAGIIEPGHFRFQCYGENVLNLEIALGYLHRGVERALIKGPNKRTIHYAETVAGDTTVGHTLAYAQGIEALSSTEVPPRAEYIRGIALELERLANHVGNMGSLAADIGFLPVTSSCGKLRGDFLNMTAILCGNRFGRNLVVPGGVAFDLDEDSCSLLKKSLKKSFEEAKRAIELLWHSTMIMDRFEKVGILPHEQALNLGVVGLVARSSNISRDVRKDFPSGVYQKVHIKTETLPSGDIYARAFLRFKEIENSYHFVITLLDLLPAGDIMVKTSKLIPEHMAISTTEGWRGEIAHIISTNEEGLFLHYKIVDPSFHNWPALAVAMKKEQISNFPPCNNSFNLSYCGHDL